MRMQTQTAARGLSRLILLPVVALSITLFAGSPMAQALVMPSQISCIFGVPTEVKDLLDRDFRSRYPVAALQKTDVVSTEVKIYNVFSVLNGMGGFDTRHHFQVEVIHETGARAWVEVNVYERREVEPNQDPLFIETFRIVSWMP